MELHEIVIGIVVVVALFVGYQLYKWGESPGKYKIEGKDDTPQNSMEIKKSIDAAGNSVYAIEMGPMRATLGSLQFDNSRDASVAGTKFMTIQMSWIGSALVVKVVDEDPVKFVKV